MFFVVGCDLRLYVIDCFCVWLWRGAYFEIVCLSSFFLASSSFLFSFAFKAHNNKNTKFEH